MKKVLTGLILVIYLISSVIAVLAAPASVVSDPALFSLIKTETSKNNTVTVHGDHLSFDFGKGLGGNIYGFQPNSIYSYKNLFMVRNITDDDLSVWYTLDGHLKDFNEEEIISLNIPDASGGIWHPEQVLVLPAETNTGGIDFLFAIPAKQQLGTYSGSITVHASQDVPDNPVALVPLGAGPPGNESDSGEPETGEDFATGEDVGGQDTPERLDDETPAEQPENSTAAELALAPEAPQTALLGDDLIFSLSNWPYLLLIPLPLLAWLLMSRRVLILVPVEEDRYKVVVRKIARRRDKKWLVNVEKELDKYLAEYGQIVVDFRGGFLRKADKSVYAGEFLLGASDLRYARISSRRFTSWTASLKKKRILAVG